MSMMTDCRVSNQHDADNVLNATAVNFGNDGKMIVLPVPGVSGDLKNVCVRLADSVTQRNSARMLINKMYAWRGYGENHNIPARPTHSTFTASDGDVLIGTLTLAVDSHTGLAADAIFQEEIDVFRRQSGAKVCELTKLAFNSTVPSKPMLAALFHIVFIYGQRKHRCTDLFIEVHPRHRRFYQAMLGFKPIGEVKINTSVNAPAQLMVLKIAQIREKINQYAGQGDSASARSLYPFFFSPREEDGIYNRFDTPQTEIEREFHAMPFLSSAMQKPNVQAISC